MAKKKEEFDESQLTPEMLALFQKYESWKRSQAMKKAWIVRRKKRIIRRLMNVSVNADELQQKVVEVLASATLEDKEKYLEIEKNLTPEERTAAAKLLFNDESVQRRNSINSRRHAAERRYEKAMLMEGIDKTKPIVLWKYNYRHGVEVFDNIDEVVAFFREGKTTAGKELALDYFEIEGKHTGLVTFRLGERRQRIIYAFVVNADLRPYIQQDPSDDILRKTSVRTVVLPADKYGHLAENADN